MKKPTQINLRLPPDVLADLDAVCPPASRSRNQFIIEAIRAKLATEPAALRQQEERDAAARLAAFKEKREFERRVEEAQKIAPGIVDALGADEARVEEWIVTGSDGDGLLIREVIRLAEERRAAEGSDG